MRRPNNHEANRPLASVAAVIVMALLAPLLGCRGNVDESAGKKAEIRPNDVPSAASIVRIGVAAPTTGPSAPAGIDYLNGAALAIEKANRANPTIGGKAVVFKLVPADAQGETVDPSLAQKLVSEDVAAVVGHLNSGVTVPASEIFARAGVPVVTTGGGSVFEKYPPLQFRAGPTDEEQTVAIAAYVADRLSAKKIAIIDDKSAYGSGLANELERQLAARKLYLVGRQHLSDKATNFKEVVARLKVQKPEVIFFGGMDAVAAPLIKQAREAGINAVFALGDGACTDELSKLAGKAAEGVICTQPGIPLTNASKEFSDAFKAKFGEVKGDSPYAYDATLSIVDAMRRADSTSPSKFAPEIRNVSVRGATGRVEFDSSGMRKDPKTTLYQVSEGKMAAKLVHVQGGFEKPSGVTAYWNAWVRAAEEKRSAHVLELNRKYTLSLDLARLAYANESSTSASDELRHYLDKYPDATIELVVRATVIDASLELSGLPDSSMRVQVPKLRSQADDSAMLARLDKSPLDEDIASAVRAGTYQLAMIPRQAGCLSIGFSIWDQTGTYPLDHILIRLYVGNAADAEAKKCSTGIVSRSVRSGIETMLEIGSYWKGGQPAVDGSLYIFEDETGRNPKAFAVFVAGQRKEGGPVQASAKWTMQAPSSFLTGTFYKKIVAARTNATRTVSQQYPYSGVAEDLKTRLFPPGDEDARKAFDLLQETVRQAKDVPKILVKTVSKGQVVGYLPLGLLAARSEHPVLERQIVAIHPLPRPRYSRAHACIDGWTFGVSETLTGAPELQSNIRFIDSIREPWMKKRLSTKKLLQQYFEGAAPKEASPEGLVLLAHHDQGDLWYDRQENSIPVIGISRAFPKGSVAVLASCSTAAPEPNQRMLLDKLNELDVDAIVMSPFPVDTPFADRLSREFAATVQRSRGTGFTLLDLFQIASKKTVDHFQGNQADRLPSEMALEFVIAGNYGVRLCSAKELTR